MFLREMTSAQAKAWGMRCGVGARQDAAEACAQEGGAASQPVAARFRFLLLLVVVLLVVVLGLLACSVWSRASQRRE